MIGWKYSGYAMPQKTFFMFCICSFIVSWLVSLKISYSILYLLRQYQSVAVWCWHHNWHGKCMELLQCLALRLLYDTMTYEAYLDWTMLSSFRSPHTQNLLMSSQDLRELLSMKFWIIDDMSWLRYFVPLSMDYKGNNDKFKWVMCRWMHFETVVYNFIGIVCLIFLHANMFLTWFW